MIIYSLFFLFFYKKKRKLGPLKFLYYSLGVSFFWHNKSQFHTMKFKTHNKVQKQIKYLTLI